jgi:hypothetical protein
VNLRPVVAGSGTGGEGLGGVIEDAWQSSLDFLGEIGAGVITAVVFVWWVPLVGAPLALVGARVLRNRPRPAEAID